MVDGNDLTLTGTVSLGNASNVLTIKNHTTIKGVISDGSGIGAGSIDKQGEGTLTLSGLNTYTGATTVTSGTLNLSGTGGITGGGALNVTGGTFNMATGSILTAGTINLSAGGTFNQTGGTLDFTDFSQNGGGATFTDLNLGRNFGNQSTYNLSGGSVNATYEYVGNAGSGSVTQTGGTHTVSGDLHIGDETGAGLYTLSGGNLRVYGTEYIGINGAFTHTGGTHTVNTLDLSGGGTYDLRGAGVLAVVQVTGNLTNAGTVNPGNSVGTMNVNGHYTQTATGNYTLEIASPAGFDKITVTGSASLNGTLTPTLLGGYRPNGNQVFSNIITAGGGVTGAFGSIANPSISPTLFWQPRYHPGSVDLAVLRSYNNPGLGLTANQAAVGAMLDGLSNGAGGDLNEVMNNLDQLTSNSQVASAYQQISPDKAAALTTMGFAGASLQWQGLSNRINSLRYGVPGPGSFGGLGSLSLQGSSLTGLMLAYNSSSLAGLITRERPKAPENRWGIYLKPGGILGSLKSSAHQTGFDFSVAGFNAGADFRVRDHLLVGLGTGYSYTGANFFNAGGRVDTNTWPLTAYVAYLPESFYAFGSLGYALNLYHLDRNIVFGGINRTAKSTTTGNQFNAYGEAGCDLKTGRLVLTPLVSLAYSSLWLNGYTESGAGSLDLTVASQQAASLQTSVGGKLTLPLRLKSTRVIPQIYATYQHEFADGARGLDARLSQGGTSFGFETEQAGRDFAVVGANVTLYAKENCTIQINYNAEVGRDRYTAHVINAGLRWEF